MTDEERDRLLAAMGPDGANFLRVFIPLVSRGYTSHDLGMRFDEVHHPVLVRMVGLGLLRTCEAGAYWFTARAHLVWHAAEAMLMAREAASKEFRNYHTPISFGVIPPRRGP